MKIHPLTVVLQVMHALTMTVVFNKYRYNYLNTVGIVDCILIHTHTYILRSFFPFWFLLTIYIYIYIYISIKCAHFFLFGSY